MITFVKSNHLQACMKKMRSLLWICVGCMAVSCSQSARQKSGAQAEVDARVVAAVDGHSITVADLQAELMRRYRGKSLGALTASDRDALLQQMLQNQSAYARAVAEGFDEAPQIQRQVRELIVSRYLEGRMANSSVPEIQESDIQQYYEAHASEFAIPERVHFAVIKIGVSPKATETKRSEAFARAQAILEQARGSGEKATFEALARAHSEDQATRYQGGDAGWVSRDKPDRWDVAVVAAAFQLEKPGEVSPVVSTPDAFYVVKMIDRSSAARRPLAEVKTAIAYQLGILNREKAQSQFFENLKSGQRIEINRPLLESLSAPVQQTETKPPGVPAG